MVVRVADIGAKVKLLRKKAGFTQQQLADYLAVDQSLIAKVEKGERSLSSDALQRLASLFCCPLRDLVAAQEVKPVYTVAFRAAALQQEELQTLAVINKIALNQLQMDELSEEAEEDA